MKNKEPENNGLALIQSYINATFLKRNYPNSISQEVQNISDLGNINIKLSNIRLNYWHTYEIESTPEELVERFFIERERIYSIEKFDPNDLEFTAEDLNEYTEHCGELWSRIHVMDANKIILSIHINSAVKGNVYTDDCRIYIPFIKEYYECEVSHETYEIVDGYLRHTSDGSTKEEFYKLPDGFKIEDGLDGLVLCEDVAESASQEAE